jgi:Putative DNA-binding domain
MIDLFTADLNYLPNDQLYAAISGFAQAQPNESNRHDFKREWTNDALQDVAAFANTFGGILIIGVRKGQMDTAATLVGVESASELTTRIASAIATNISPSPSFDIAECHQPGFHTHRFCIIRIRNNSTLHLVTKKGIANPVWFRNADQTIPADAAQLRMMIDREQQVIGNADAELANRADHLFKDMWIGSAYDTPARWPASNHMKSPRFFKLALLPLEKKYVPLDLRSEEAFLNLVHRSYNRIQPNADRSVALQYVSRSDEFYEYRWYHKSLDYEGRWRVTNRLEIAHAMGVNSRPQLDELSMFGQEVLIHLIDDDFFVLRERVQNRLGKLRYQFPHFIFFIHQ